MSVIVGERAKELFKSGLYCSESVLKAIAESQGIESVLIPSIATGFGSGISRTCDNCGALSGGIMAIGLVFGRKGPQDSVEKCFSVVQELIERFSNEFGSINCQELIGYDLGNEEENRQFDESGKITLCLDYTGKAAEMASELIQKHL